MDTVKLRETDDYIKLGQALKLAGLVGSGVEAKELILDGKIMVNGEPEFQRGKKLYDGFTVKYGDSEFVIKSNNE